MICNAIGCDRQAESNSNYCEACDHDRYIDAQTHAACLTRLAAAEQRAEKAEKERDEVYDTLDEVRKNACERCHFQHCDGAGMNGHAPDCDRPKTIECANCCFRYGAEHNGSDETPESGCLNCIWTALRKRHTKAIAALGWYKRRLNRANAKAEAACLLWDGAEKAAGMLDKDRAALAATLANTEKQLEIEVVRAEACLAERDALAARCEEMAAALREAREVIWANRCQVAWASVVVGCCKKIDAMLAQTPASALAIRDLERRVVEAARPVAEWALEHGHAPAGFLGDFKVQRAALAALDAAKAKGGTSK